MPLISALPYLPKLELLPLAIAGPILRRTESRAVTVWLALKNPELVTLKIYATDEGKGKIIGNILLEGKGQTIPLGQNLHLVAVTARPIGNNCLQPGQVYAYDLDFARTQINLTAATTTNLASNLSYFPHQLPTFSLPPDNLDWLKIVHGSCRKPHGGGIDTLSYLDNLIAAGADLANERPHQLLMTGDQIYGDDVADPMLWLLQGVSKLLFDWNEELPLIEGTILSQELPPGKRSELSRIEGGFTGMLDGKSDKAKSHLLSFAEYAAAYLIAWSPLLTPSKIPAGKNLFGDSKQATVWDREVKNINSFIQGLTSVRRALANVPVYTICDDHEISDDWYLNREWCDRVLSKPLGRRVIQNGLLAYSLFQAWGNTPELFETDTAGEKLLKSASRWLTSQGKDLSALAKCDRFLGIPPLDKATGLPQMELDEDVLILKKDSEAIPWHYQVTASSHEIIVLDTRTWRGYPPGKGKKLKPPMLLSPQGFKRQLQIPLQLKQPHIKATFVVLPTNLVALKIIDRIQQWHLSRNRVFSTDVGDSWNFHQEAFAELILSLGQQRDRVIILSGDIHYSCAVRLTYQNLISSSSSVLVQLTSSAIKNSELVTCLIHTKLKSLLPEPTEQWWGWGTPLKMTEIKQPGFWEKLFKRYNKLPELNSPPEWQYRIEWCKRQPAKSLAWQQPQSTAKPHLNLRQKLIRVGLNIVWRNRWLQEGTEVIGRNNLSLVKFQWSNTKVVIQETYWHPPWNDTGMVKSSYVVSLESEQLTIDN